MGIGWFFIFAGVFFLAVAIYYWLFVHEKGASDPHDVIKAQQRNVDTNSGIIKNKYTKAKINSQTGVQEAVTENKRAVVETLRQEKEAIEVSFNKQAVAERHRQNLEKESAETGAYLAQKRTEEKEHQLMERLIDLALAQGIDVNTYLKQRMNEEDVRKLEQETMLKLKAGFVYQLQDYQKLIMLRSNLDELYDRENLVESGSEPNSVKQKKLAQIKADIETLEKDADGRRQRLLQANNGEEI